VTTPESDPLIGVRAEGETVERIQEADDSLSQRIEALRQTLGELTPEVARIQVEQKSVWGWLKGGAGFIAFDIIITIIGIIFGLSIHRVENDNRVLLDQVQNQQDRVNTNIHETCTLYGIFMSFYSDAAKARFAGGPAAYDQGYIKLQGSADRLQCGLKHVVPGT
jgi:hypothetical protein